MVLLDSVTELVDDDVVLDAGSKLHHLGMKLQDIPGVAARPSALKVADAYTGSFQPSSRSQCRTRGGSFSSARSR